MQEIVIARKIFFSSGVIYRPPGLDITRAKQLYGDYAASSHGFGHNYKLEAFYQGPIDPKTGLVVNLSDIDPLLKQLIAPLDHQNLSKTLPYFKEQAPTLERIANYCYDNLKQLSKDLPSRLIRIRLYQGDQFWCDYGEA